MMDLVGFVDAGIGDAVEFLVSLRNKEREELVVFN